ncbi:peptidoglycan/LPS O-acetylase OafA/YrhL [Paraburkholderia sp. GAS38]|jgi:peptidoglycan/LPS O-acetylase OafA/YrhL|uniref:acyltransferase family protein n=1 Tax=Paraburkholderia sp. GAS38 TaxID=3035133 RepID=UPI003D246228
MAPAINKHCDTLDLIRALAAAAVCVSHIRALLFVDYRAGLHLGLIGQAFYFLSNYGHTAVTVFFVLSGYFVGGTVIRQVAAGTWSWQRYLGERLSRLWIVLIPALILTLFWDRMGLATIGGPFYLGTEGNFDQRVNVAAQLGHATLFCNVAFLQTLYCGTYGSNGPLWSLANEFWYYLWFPACYVLVGRRRMLQGLVVLGLALGSMVLFQPLLNGFVLWLLGALIAWIEKRIPRRAWRSRYPVSTWVSGVLFLVALAATRWQKEWADEWTVGFACFAFIACVLREDVRLRSPRLSRLAIAFSGFSYSLYLTHFPFVLFLIATMIGHRIQPDGYGALVFIALLAACYVYAYAVYFLFERNTRRVQRLIQQFHPFGTKPEAEAAGRVGS